MMNIQEGYESPYLNGIGDKEKNALIIQFYNAAKYNQEIDEESFHKAFDIDLNKFQLLNLFWGSEGKEKEGLLISKGTWAEIRLGDDIEPAIKALKDLWVFQFKDNLKSAKQKQALTDRIASWKTYQDEKEKAWKDSIAKGEEQAIKEQPEAEKILSQVISDVIKEDTTLNQYMETEGLAPTVKVIYDDVEKRLKYYLSDGDKKFYYTLSSDDWKPSIIKEYVKRCLENDANDAAIEKVKTTLEELSLPGILFIKGNRGKGYYVTKDKQQLIKIDLNKGEIEDISSQSTGIKISMDKLPANLELGAIYIEDENKIKDPNSNYGSYSSTSYISYNPESLGKEFIKKLELDEDSLTDPKDSFLQETNIKVLEKSAAINQPNKYYTGSEITNWIKKEVTHYND